MNVWDWHYKVYFDDKLYRAVREWSKGLLPKEAEIVQKTLDFYRSFFTFGILLEQISTAPDNSRLLIETALQDSSRLVRVPTLLLETFRKRIDELPIPVPEKNQLQDLLSQAMQGKEIRTDLWAYLHWIMGDNYSRLLGKILDPAYSSYHTLPHQKTILGDHRSLFDDIFSKLQQAKLLVERFGPSAISDFTTTIQEGSAYGEWWDQDLTGDPKDQLILYTSDQAVKNSDYLYTIIHETYPGHGHFYNYVRNPRTQMDHGANLLVEGWATYCEWHSIPSDYADTVRHNDIVFLYNSYCCSLNDFADALWKNKKKNHIPFEKALPSLFYATQYIGYLESYYMGGLWLEDVIDTQRIYTPQQFLDRLRCSNKGDFFRLWQ